MTLNVASDPIQRFTSWYGLPAEIGVENGLWHLVRVGRVALGHPPLVNLVLRRGLPEKDRLELSFFHEFGHLQTLPLALSHLLLVILLGRWQWLGWRALLKKLAAAAIAHEAVWELASESYVIEKTGERYRQIYQDHPNPWGQALFWLGMALLAVGASAEVLRQG